MFGRRIVRWILAAGLTILSLGSPSTRFAVAQPNPVAVVGTDRLALRRGPGKNFSPFDSLKAGSKVEIEEIQDEWARVITPNGQRGYVHSNFLQIPGEPAPASVAAPPEIVQPAATPTAARPTERRRPATPTPISIAKKRGAMTPTRTPADRPKAADTEATGTRERAKQATDQVSALTARNTRLEAELRAVHETLTALRAKDEAPAADMPTELARLTATVETLKSQLKAREAGGSGATGGGVSEPDVRQGLSGTTVGAGVLGIAIGWLLGTVFGRRSDRSRRSRIRF